MMETRTLYRPVGLKEMELILQAGAKVFPPRLPEQPIFYPVLNYEYAEQIASRWNTKDERSGYAGFVTQFEVAKPYVDHFEEHQVGASIHRELWVPAEQLDEFNQHIQGQIQIVGAFYGEHFEGAKYWYPQRERNAIDQFLLLFEYEQRYPFDFWNELFANRVAIQINYRYWMDYDFSTHMTEQAKQNLLRRIAENWRNKFPDISLFGT